MSANWQWEYKEALKFTVITEHNYCLCVPWL